MTLVKIKPALNRVDVVVWYFEVNGVKYKAKKKKNKYGDLTGKTYIYTNSHDGMSYYNTTALAVFNKSYWLTQILGIQLVMEDGEGNA